MGAVALYIAIYILLFIHELGHFGYAKMAGIKIQTFQIGLLPVINFKLGETQIRFGLLPLIGFVLPDEKQYEEISRKSKILLALSGPFASAALGFVLFVLSGRPLLESLLMSMLLPVIIPFVVFLNPSSLVITAEQNNLVGMMEMANMLNTTPSQMLRVVGIISIGLAGLNLIPIPPLDGGRAVFETLEVLFGKNKVSFIQVNGKNPSVISVLGGILTAVFLLYMIYTMLAEVWFIILRFLP